MKNEIERLPKRMIEEIFSTTDMRAIPKEYIIMVRFQTTTGKVYSFTGKEYKQFVEKNPNVMGKIEFALDIERFGEDIKIITESIFSKND